MKVELSPQAIEFLRSLAPEPRRALTLAIKRLPSGQGDIKVLKGALGRFWRLRVKTYRVIFQYDEQVIRCEFVEKLSVVYDLFAQGWTGEDDQ